MTFEKRCKKIDYKTMLQKLKNKGEDNAGKMLQKKLTATFGKRCKDINGYAKKLYENINGKVEKNAAKSLAATYKKSCKNKFRNSFLMLQKMAFCNIKHCCISFLNGNIDPTTHARTQQMTKSLFWYSVT